MSVSARQAGEVHQDIAAISRCVSLQAVLQPGASGADILFQKGRWLPAPLLVVLLGVLAAAFSGKTAIAHADDASGNTAWQASGDVRAGYLSSKSRSRSAETSSDDSLRARLRLGMRAGLGSSWHLGGRAALRLDSKQNHMEFWLRSHAPSPAGLESGQGTLDEAYLEYRPPEVSWSLRLGRFQAAFALEDIMGKSLDQNDSSSFDVTWTDGAWLQWHGPQWHTHLIVRHNDRRGPSGVLRQPLDFRQDGARTGVFLASRANAAAGPFIQRMVTLTWLPHTPLPPGQEARRQSQSSRDYLAATLKTAAQWPLPGTRKFRLAAEAGYAVNAPRREVMNSGSGSASTLSWQSSLNLIEILPDQDFGVIYGRIADGWLLSSDFRPNDSLAEARWVWRVNPSWQLDARLRHRRELHLPATARARREEDLYLRATWRF